MISTPNSPPPIPLQARGKMRFVLSDEKNFHPVWIMLRCFWKTLQRRKQSVRNAQFSLCVFCGHTFMNPQNHAPRRQDFPSEASRSGGFKNGPAGLPSREPYLVLKAAVSMAMASTSQIHLQPLLSAPSVQSKLPRSSQQHCYRGRGISVNWMPQVCGQICNESATP